MASDVVDEVVLVVAIIDAAAVAAADAAVAATDAAVSFVFPVVSEGAVTTLPPPPIAPFFK